MRHTESIRKIDYVLGTALLVGSLLALFTAGKLLTSPRMESAAATKVLQVSAAQCTKSLTAAGIAHSTHDGKVVIKEPSERALPSLVERGSLAVQSCPGYELTSFCAGEQCLPGAGLSAVLAVKER